MTVHGRSFISKTKKKTRHKVRQPSNTSENEQSKEDLRDRMVERRSQRTHLAAWTGVLHTCTFVLRKLPSQLLLQRRFGGTCCCSAQEQRRTSQNSPRRTQMAMSTPEQSAKCLGWFRSLREPRLMGRRADGTTEPQYWLVSGCRTNNLEFYKE